MKKRSVFLVTCILLLFPAMQVFAQSTEAQSEYDSELSIILKKGEKEKPAEPKEPIVKPTKPNPVETDRLLPNTGEMILSIIIMLLGVSLIIMAFSLYIARKIRRLKYLR